MMRKILAVVFCFFGFCIISQNDNEPMPRVSFRATCGIPKSFSSQAFRFSFGGVYDAGLSVNVRVFDNFFMGLGYQNGLFVPQKYFRDKYVNNGFISTRMQTHDAYLKIGYDKWFIDKSRGFYTFALNTGYNYSKYTAIAFPSDTLASIHPTDNFTGIFVRPEVTFNFLVDPGFAFGIVFAYNYNLTKYDPKINMFSYYGDFSKYKNRAGISWISFGFNMYFGLGKRNQ